MTAGRRAARGEQLAPALFPFLAVLLCTMGALVLVLVLITTQASVSAKQAIEVQKQELQDVSDMVEITAEELKAGREKRQEAIEAKRSQLAAIEDHIQRLVDELEQLRLNAQAMADRNQLSEAERDQREQTIESLKQRIADEAAKLEEQKEKLAKSPPAFAIIPYNGANGTSRRPIYLECTADGVIIQPEGLLISMNDLRPPHGPGNPLDASLRLIRTAYQKSGWSSSASPYPLLLVRPNGITSYALARSAMSGWDDQFGYELIDQSMPLAFPPSIPGLTPQLASTLETARQRQAALIAAMPRRALESEWNESIEGLQPEPNRGPSAARLNSNDWNEVDETPLANNGSDRWRMVKESPGQYQASPAVSDPSRSTQPMVATNQGSPLKASQSPAELLPNGDQAWNNPSPSSSETSNLAAGQLNQPTTGASPTSWGKPAEQSTIVEQNIDPSQATSFGDNPAATSTQSPPPNSMASSDPSQLQNYERKNDAMFKPENENVEAGVMIQPKQKPDKESNTQSRPPPPASWTSTRRITNGTAVSRSINVVIMPDRWFFMRDDRPDQVEQVISLQQGPAVARQKLQQAINERVDSWGVAVAKGYWEPRLILQVAPKAELSRERFEKLMQDADLEMQVETLK
jgi:hypothetical protein